MRFAIDGGGTTTRLAIAGPLRSTSEPIVYRSINPSSVDADDAVTLLSSALREVAAYAAYNGGIPVEGVVASAAVSPYTIGHWQAVLTDILSGLCITAAVLLTNDIDALLLAPPVNGSGGVLVAGTGSGAMVAADGVVVRVGGWEYLASDEGSAFWLGRAGLAAAVRAVDGRGGPTSIAARIESRHGASVGELARTLAELPHPRQAVADLAQCVTDAWVADADEVAAGLVTAAVDELALLVSAGNRRSGSRPATWALTGGMVVQSAEFGRLLQRRIGTVSEGSAVHIVCEPVLALLASTRLMDDRPGLVRATIKVLA